MKRRVWLDAVDITAYHAEQIAEHGGDAALRDRGLLESALARPRNLAAYGTPTAFDLAAAYAFGIAKNHPFVDGNKRAAFVACVTFLELNGWQFVASEEDAAAAFLALANSGMTEKEIAAWLRARSREAMRKR